ncbi:hypothetical protein ACJJIE_11420 [Microbulbifer sp. TRSA001]|uniref:hypothetical protein n=1 Tax=Microbulbifer sp. TRSA001 TaxID=3243381 RepID=UPI004039B4B9
MEKFSLPMIAATILTGCAVNPNNVSIDPQKATIVARSDNGAGVLVPLSTTKRSRIEKVNGVSVSSFFSETNVLTLDPGEYILEISCHMISGSINVSGSTEHQINLEAGNKYVFSSVFDNNKGCKTTYEASKT